ncbi:hypothetical protein DEO72_LG7g1933 [Vigna unguiculata]|uniref:Uncharacterized protein n=1 Tax=Vigna unguiculata TaxID=3917 RepID=A0A4D6MGT9_VIGUN|nr:hypothetical protein DEO72_LG7g1933 [Vigna unguiculata]
MTEVLGLRLLRKRCCCHERVCYFTFEHGAAMSIVAMMKVQIVSGGLWRDVKGEEEDETHISEAVQNGKRVMASCSGLCVAVVGPASGVAMVASSLSVVVVVQRSCDDGVAVSDVNTTVVKAGRTERTRRKCRCGCGGCVWWTASNMAILHEKMVAPLEQVLPKWRIATWCNPVEWSLSVVARNISIELWLGIGVKYVVFLELWLEIASLKLWLGMADEQKELLSCGSGWRVLLVDLVRPRDEAGLYWEKILSEFY